MGSIPLPALQVRPPEQPDVLGQAQKAVSLGSLLQAQQQRAAMAPGEQTLQQQQIESQQLQIQQAQRDQQDQEIFRKAFLNSGGDLEKSIDLAAKGGASPKAILSAKASLLDHQTKLATLTKDQLANMKSQADMVGQSANAVLNAPVEQKDSIYQAERARLIQSGIPQDQIPPQRPPDDILKAHALSAMTVNQQVEAAAAKRKQDWEESQGAAVEKQELKSFMDNPPKGYDRSPAGFAKWKASLAPIAQIAVINATQRGNDAAVANVPAKEAPKARADFAKVGQEYAGAVQASEDMKTFIESMRNGNKVAYSYAPTEGVLTLNTGRGVKRVNMAEIKSYGGAGSTWDRIQAWFGKHVSGASIPDDIIGDMEDLHGAIAGNAKNAYSNKVKVINKTYGSSFEPVDLENKTPKTPSTGGFDWNSMPEHK